MRKIVIILGITSIIIIACGQATKKQTESNGVVYGQEKNNTNKKIPSNFDIEKEFNITDFTIIPENDYSDKYHLIDSIIPDSYYYYWECVFDFLDDNRQIYVYNGDSLHFAEKTKKITSNSGFFYECQRQAATTLWAILLRVSSQNTLTLISTKF